MSARKQAAGLPAQARDAEINHLQMSPVVLDDSALRGLLGEIKKTPYDDGIWQCVEAAKQSSQTR